MLCAEEGEGEGEGEGEREGEGEGEGEEDDGEAGIPDNVPAQVPSSSQTGACFAYRSSLRPQQSVAQPSSEEGIQVGVAGSIEFGLPISGGSPGVHAQLDMMGHAAYPILDPFYCGMLAAYGAPPTFYQQMLGAQVRRPLPSDITEEEPVYVNAKQYNGIMRRRQSRAKAEIENKLVKCRKPYLHESRHQHAKRRVRGCGGRFLKVKSDENSKTNSSEEPNGNAHQDKHHI